MIEPTWAEIELFAGQNIATAMTEKLRVFLQIIFYNVRTDH
jgi:hypothetical protein